MSTGGLFSVLLSRYYSQLSLPMHKNKRRLKIPAIGLKKLPNITKMNSCDANFVAMSTDQYTWRSVCGLESLGQGLMKGLNCTYQAQAGKEMLAFC